MHDSSAPELELTPDLLEYAKAVALKEAQKVCPPLVSFDDAVSDALLHLISKPPKHDPARGASPKTLIYTVVQRAVLKFVGRECKHARRFKQVVSPTTGNDDDREDALDALALGEEVERHLKNLNVPSWGNVAIDLERLDASGQIALLADHDARVSGVVGHGSAEVRDGRLFVNGVMSGAGEAANQIVEMSRGGFAFTAVLCYDMSRFSHGGTNETGFCLHRLHVAGVDGGKWNSSQIKRLLENPVYRGAIAWNKRTLGKLHGVAGDGTLRPKRGARSGRNDRDDWFVVGRLRNVLLADHDGAAAAIDRLVDAAMSRHDDRGVADAKAAEKDLAAVERRIKATIGMLADPAFDGLDELKVTLADLKKCRDALRSQLDRGARDPDMPYTERDLRDWADGRFARFDALDLTKGAPRPRPGASSTPTSIASGSTHTSAAGRSSCPPTPSHASNARSPVGVRSGTSPTARSPRRRCARAAR